jgi:hypothetical protein
MMIIFATTFIAALQIKQTVYQRVPVWSSRPMPGLLFCRRFHTVFSLRTNTSVHACSGDLWAQHNYDQRVELSEASRFLLLITTLSLSAGPARLTRPSTLRLHVPSAQMLQSTLARRTANIAILGSPALSLSKKSATRMAPVHRQPTRGIS